MSNEIVLPATDKDGNFYVSYSQIKLWNEKRGFNTGLLGKKEFMRHYFLGEQYDDKGGYGTFGSQVEAYITERKEADKFTDVEKATLDKIAPLAVFQQEISIPFDGFYLKGFIDDRTADYSHIRDYKTASEKSKEKYEADDYNQLDIYALGIKQLTKKLPKKLEVVVIERLGNGFKGGRQVLSVGERIWYIPRETSVNRLKTLQNHIVQTVEEISKYYKIFQKINT